ncbi:MAG: helix-turn-helix transcriptional regulator [Nitrospirae bacterium]|nr:helix-turn-helix transcriptional regulator [Nitrospirota bacterium]
MRPWHLTLRRLRLELGLTQEQLARRAGMARPSLTRVERGQKDLTVSSLLRLSQALGMDPARFFEEAPAPKPLGRHGIDRIARAVVAGHGGDRKEESHLIQGLAYQLRPSLEASKAPGAAAARRAARRNYEAIRQEYRPEDLEKLMRRVHALLAALPA